MSSTETQKVCGIASETANLSCSINTESLASSNAQFPAVLKGKKILLATESLGPINGVSKTTGHLIEYLRQHQVDVAVVAPEISHSKVNTSQLAAANLRLFGWPLPYNPDLTIAYPFRTDRVFRRTFLPDLIYLASPASVGFQVLLQSRLLANPPPVVCNFQTDLSSYGEIIFPAYMASFAVWLLGVVQGYLFNSPAVHTVFYPCLDIQRYLESTGTCARKLVHLGRGVDTTLFNPDKRDIMFRQQHASAGEPILLCVSRLAPEKGFDFLARVALQLAKTVQFKLVIVGGNRNASVQAQIQQYFDPIRDRVVFTGFLTGDALARVYSSADIFLHCSITETFGLVVLESMASGVPVIARDQGGPSQIVRHDKTGYLVPKDDLDTFVTSVTTLCEDVDLRLNFAVASRIVALESTWEKINNKAAWYIANSLRQHELEFARRAKNLTEEKLTLSVHHLVLAKTKRILETFKLWFAMIVVSMFWIIACLPLILHGTLKFKSE